MLSKVNSGALIGVEALPVEVEVNSGERGEPRTFVVGLPDAAVKESVNRVSSAMANSGFAMPMTKMTVNLAPGDIKKEGPIYDLPISLGILASTGIVDDAKLREFVVAGELSLSGDLRAICGGVSLALLARSKKMRGVILPPDSAAEAALVEGIEVYTAKNLRELVDFLNGNAQLKPVRAEDSPFRDFRRAMPVILMLLFLDLFDTIATVVALGRRSGMMSEDGHMKNIGRALVADATATIGGAMLGTSTTGAYVESAAGIEAGGRTGVVPLVVAALFLLSLFVSPLINAIPAAATAPALVLVGIMMMQGLKDLKFDDLDEVIPTFFCMMIMALTFKISEGFAFGIIAYTLILVAKKRAREIRRTTWLIFVVMCLFVALS